MSQLPTYDAPLEPLPGTASFPLPPQPTEPPPVERLLTPRDEDRRVRVLGVDITDVSMPRAVEMLHQLIDLEEESPRLGYFVNAHTLNLSARVPGYRDVLRRATIVFGDGTGVRWAARMKGVRLRANLCGTDLLPALLDTTPGRRFFMLGADEATIQRAAANAEMQFPNWTLLGYHHGYVKSESETARVIELINAIRPDLLLVGMGNPIQEQWLDANRHRLNARLCMAVGGLFDFWAGTVSRAPRWIRGLGYEWVWRLMMQPRQKAQRYLIGNPLFLARAVRDARGQ